MNIAGFYEESISNGEGWRAVVFVSGCPHHCPGCHNEPAQDFSYGEPFNQQEILDKIKDNFILQGVTLSGGEPLCPENIPEVTGFMKEVKKLNLDIWCYSGYTFEELLEGSEDQKRLLETIDILIDGPFLQAQKSLEIAFRGSRNQRILDVPKSLAAGCAVETTSKRWLGEY